jgi:hypothetical protein
MTVVQFVPSGVDADVNRTLVRQGWKPHRELVSVGGTHGPARYSLYRKTLVTGETAYLSWHSSENFSSCGLEGPAPFTMVLDVDASDGRRYSDNVHEPREAGETADELATDLRDALASGADLQEKMLFGTRPPAAEQAADDEVMR